MLRTIFVIISFFCCAPVLAQSLLRDISSGIYSSHPYFIGQVNGKQLFFTDTLINTTSNGPWSVYATDGTEKGTVKVLAMNAEMQFIFEPVIFPPESELPVFNNRLIIPAKQTATNWELYTSDGTPSGTKRIISFEDSVFQITFGRLNPVVLKSSFLFATTNYNGNVYLWKSDGTKNGTKIIMKHFSYKHFGQYEGMPYHFTTIGNSAYFISLSDTNKVTYWRISEPDYQPQAIATFPRPGLGNGYVPQAFKDKVYFSVLDSGSTGKVWVSNGTTAGTYPLQDYPGGPFATHFGLLSVSGNNAFFVSSDTTYGQELWLTDGSVSGTRLVKDIAPGQKSGVATLIGKTSKYIFFLAKDTSKSVFNLWRSDGTEPGTIRLPGTYLPTVNGFERFPYAYVSSVAVNNNLYFQNFTQKLINESELWVTDGTPEGTKPVVNHDSLYITPSIYSPSRLVYFNNRVYFSASTMQTGVEVHYTDSCLCKTDANLMLTGKLYPNPASDHVTIDISWDDMSNYQNADLTVYDAIGKRVILDHFRITGKCLLFSFETGNFSQGVYTAVLNIGYKRFTKKFVVLR